MFRVSGFWHLAPGLGFKFWFRVGSVSWSKVEAQAEP